MGVRIVIRDEFSPKAANVGARHRQRLAAMETTVGLIQAGVVIASPVGVTSVLRGSWRSEVHLTGHSVVGVVGSPQVHAEIMEVGRRPGARQPPLEAVARWVEVKMGPGVDPFVVARSIGRKGIEGRRMLERTVQATAPIRRLIWGRHASRLLMES